MNTDDDPNSLPSLRAKLLDVDPVNAEQLRRLQEKILLLSEHRLTKRMRVWWIVGLVAAIVLGTMGGSVAMATSMDAPLRVVWWLYTAGNVFVAGFAVVLLRRGRAEPRLFFYFGNVIVILAVACLIALLSRAAATPSVQYLLGAGFGGLCVLVDLILILFGQISRSHLSTKEHLLRLELLILDSKIGLTPSHGPV